MPDQMTIEDRAAHRHWSRLLPTLTYEEYWPAVTTRSPRGATLTASAALDRDQTARLLAASRGDTVLLHAMLVAAASVCFAAASGASRIVLGVPARPDGRRAAAEADLPVPVEVAPDSTCRQHLATARSALLTAYAAQPAYPTGPQAPGDSGRCPAWLVRLADVNADPAPAVDPDPAGRDGIVSACVTGEVLTIGVTTDVVRFGAVSAERLAEQVATVAARLASQPDARLREIERLPSARRADALRLAIGTPRPPAPPLELLTDLARTRAGDSSTALTGPGGTFSRAGLRRMTELVARGLLSQPDGAVALLTGQSTLTVVGMLAALRAGRAYVVPPPGTATDPGALSSRGVAVAIGSAPVSQLEVPMLTVADLADLGRRDRAGLPGQVDPAAPAYLVLTSGSTGAAKTVMVTRGNLAESTAARIAVYGNEPGRFLLLSRLHFDSSVAGVYWTLACGGILDVAATDVTADPAALAVHVRDHAVTATLGLPRLLEEILRSAAPGDLDTLRIVIGAGERFPASLAALARTATPRTRLYNEYGPSEATVWATVHEVTGRPADVPIGRPVPGMRVYVTDRWGGLVAPGVQGELVIGGPQVTAGYLNAHAADAARFGPDPFQPGAGRVYRTGDLGRAEPDGTLRFAGRRDDEVKVLGVRVALDDVAAVFRDHPDVADAEAAVLDGGLIVAITLSGAAAAADPGAIADAVRPSLGRHVAPEIVVLPAIPRLSNGKLDRRALAAAARPAAGPAQTVPADDLERHLITVMRTALAGRALGPADNFFSAGGDSLRAASVCAELSRWLSSYVYVVALLDHRTPRDLAAFLRSNYAAELRRAGMGADGMGAQGLVPDGAVPDRTAAGPADGGRAGASPRAAASLRSAVTSYPDPRDNPPPEVLVPGLAFILGPPRSGTTLLRVMLAGHPGLFAPPELELLQYGTLTDRDRALAGRYAFYREGLVRAVMSLTGHDAAMAAAQIGEFTARGATTADMYAWIADRARGRLVIDKTTAYALDPRALARAEQIAELPRYVHLSRQPQACIASYRAAKLDSMYLRTGNGESGPHQAELIWRIAHEHIAAFLDHVDPVRVLRVRYEELVDAPEATARRLCRHLGVAFDDGMLDVHADPELRMTDGIRPEGRMLGDIKFHEHRGISSGSRDRWRHAVIPALHPATEAVARELGYTSAGPVTDAPLSSGQRWMWLLEMLSPGSTMFTIPLALAGEGTLDLTAVRRSLATLTRRHHALRSLVVAPEGEPKLRFVPDLAPPLRIEQVPAAEHAARAAELADSGFDLATTGPARLYVLRDKDQFLLLFLIHHIVADAWSVRIMVRDFLAAYDCWRRGMPPDLPPLQRQAADIASAEAARDPAEVAALARRVRSRLAGAVWALNLPPARPMPDGNRAVHGAVALDAAVAHAVRAYAAAQGTSLFPVLLAAFGQALADWTGDLDMCVGTPVLTRGPLDGDVVGMLVNTAVVRLDMTATTACELVARTAAAVREAMADADLPFEELILAAAERAGAAGEAGTLLRASFVIQDLDLPLDQYPELRLQPVVIPDPHARFDVGLAVATGGDELIVRASLARSRFDQEDAARFAADYAGRLRSLVTGRA